MSVNNAFEMCIRDRSNIIAGEKLASTLTFGQFVKAIASFLAPYIAMWGACLLYTSGISLTWNWTEKLRKM